MLMVGQTQTMKKTKTNKKNKNKNKKTRGCTQQSKTKKVTWHYNFLTQRQNLNVKHNIHRQDGSMRKICFGVITLEQMSTLVTHKYCKQMTTLTDLLKN